VGGKELEAEVMVFLPVANREAEVAGLDQTPSGGIERCLPMCGIGG